MKTVTINGVAFDLARADHRDLVELAPPSVPADRFRAMAESQKRVAELQRLYDNSQNYIQRLMEKIKRLQATPAEQLFRRLQ